MIVRVSLLQSTYREERIRFDLSLSQGLKPLPDIAYFGFWGEMKDTENSCGVLLTAEGVIDIGAGYAAHSRFHKTNILTKKIVLGEYVTIWWKFGTNEEANTYVIEAVTQLSAVTEVVKIPTASTFHIDSLHNLPRFRARVKRSFDITGYDNVTYRPPVGVEGDVAYFQDCLVFCPDNAVAKNGDLIFTIARFEELELVPEKCNAESMALIREH